MASSSSTLSSLSSSSQEWSSIRCRALKYEQEIEHKLRQLQQYQQQQDAQVEGSETATTTHTDDVMMMQQQQQNELEHQLNLFNNTIEEMISYNQRESSSSNDEQQQQPTSKHDLIRQATIKRFGDQLNTFWTEFHMMVSKNKKLNKNQNMSNYNNNNNNNDCSNHHQNDGTKKLLSTTNEILLTREHDSLCRSDHLLDTQLQMASQTYDWLRVQRETIAQTGTQLHSLSSKMYPQLNRLLQRISTRKRRNNLVILAVVTTFVLIWIVFHY